MYHFQDIASHFSKVTNFHTLHVLGALVEGHSVRISLRVVVVIDLESQGYHEAFSWGPGSMSSPSSPTETDILGLCTVHIYFLVSDALDTDTKVKSSLSVDGT